MKPSPSSLKAGPETILVVDDNEMVLQLVATILERAAFRVLLADSGASAMKLAEETAAPIDLLLSDVDMPQMTGPDLGERMKQLLPSIRVMLMSGGDHGLLVLNHGWAYLQKPFIAAKLVQMVTEVLHSPDRSQPDWAQFDTRTDAGGSR